MPPSQSRFRRSTSAQDKVIKDLKELPGLLKAAIIREPSAIPFTPPVPGSLSAMTTEQPSQTLTLNVPAPFVPFHEDDELNVCVWKTMADYKGRTSDEIIRIIEKYTDYVRADIHPCVMALNNIGWFMMLVSSKAAISKINVYTLKQGIAMPSAQQVEKNTAATFKQPDVLGAANPEGTIVASEGLDVCIWKAMSDRKPRSATEIGEILGAYGMNRGIVKDRALVLMRRGWFSRNESKRPTTYTLKKGISMPPIEQPKEEAVMGKDKLKSGPVHLVTDSTGVNKHAAKPVRAPYRSPATAAAPIAPVPPVASMVPVKTTAQLAEEARMIPSAADGIDLCIWKVMHDRRTYSANDVALLLSDTGIKAKTITVRMSKLHLTNGWFDRVSKPGEGRTYFYVLKDGIAEPKAEPYTSYNLKEETAPVVETKRPVEERQQTLKLVKEEPKDETPPVEAKQPDPVLPTVIPSPVLATNEEKKEVVTYGTLSAAARAGWPDNRSSPPTEQGTVFGESKATRMVPPTEEELVTFHVTVKGVTYTVQQAEQLTQALKAAMVNIDGREFTLDKAIELRDTLIKAGFGDTA